MKLDGANGIRVRFFTDEKKCQDVKKLLQISLGALALVATLGRQGYTRSTIIIRQLTLDPQRRNSLGDYVKNI